MRYGVDYTFTEGDKVISFLNGPITGLVTVTYQTPVDNRGHSLTYVRGPPLSTSTTYDDLIKVNVDAAGNETRVNGVGALLSIDGQRGSDQTIIYLAGATYSPTHPVSLIDVHDSIAPPEGTNKLDIYTPDQLVSDNVSCAAISWPSCRRRRPPSASTTTTP